MQAEHSTFDAIKYCALRILSGSILQTGGVSAGNGSVIDWRTVKSGDLLQEKCDAFESAQLFVSLVGTELALACASGESRERAEGPAVHAYAPQASAYGGRARSFECCGFRVMVDANEDDAAQEAFATWLAAKSLEYAT